METTDAFRARFAENYYQLLLKKGVDPSTARARARAKAAALPARIETPALVDGDPVSGARPPVSLRQPIAQVPVARPQVHLRDGAGEVPEASLS